MTLLDASGLMGYVFCGVHKSGRRRLSVWVYLVYAFIVFILLI